MIAEIVFRGIREEVIGGGVKVRIVLIHGIGPVCRLHPVVVNDAEWVNLGVSRHEGRPCCGPNRGTIEQSDRRGQRTLVGFITARRGSAVHRGAVRTVYAVDAAVRIVATGAVVLKYGRVL